MNQKLVFRILVVSLLFVSISCSKDESDSGNDSGKIKTDKQTQLLQQTIPASGGYLEISGSASPLEGLRLEVPEGCYQESKTFNISYSTITSHELGQYFNPISPLIEIQNGSDQSAKFMSLRIPIQLNQGEYAMAYYYDRKTGQLEGLPVEKITDSYIEVSIRHFSLLVISKIQKELLIQGGGFHTLFDPKQNGWSFVNYGTYPEPEGICAGMSIGAAYYYKNFKTNVNLYSYFDNDLLWFRTSDYWPDDARGLQFATAIHRIQEVFWSNNNESILKMLDAPDEDRFWNLIYAILINNQAQLVFVKNSQIDTAHMIIAFGYTINPTEAIINVYDPNYPGLESTITFDMTTNKFKPYTSAINAKALEDGTTFNCDKIAFIPFSAAMSPDEMDFLWQKVQSGTIANGLFPAFKVYAVPKDPAFTKVELNIEDNTKINYIPFGEFDFEVAGLDPNATLKMEEISFYPGIGLERTVPAQTVKMENKDTLIGLYLYATPSGQLYDKWLGFEYFKIQVQDIWIEPADTSIAINTDLKLIARHNGSAPKRARFSWNFGDSNSDTSTDSTIIHKYDQPGDYDIELIITDLESQKEVAKAKTTVNVTIWPRIAITLKGMDTNPPSTIKASDGADIPSISWANKNIITAPNLSWNKNDFVVDFQFNLDPAVYTCRIQGSVSADFKKITYLNAIYTGIAGGGDWNYQAAIVMQNFPLEVYLPKQIIGKILTGTEAQSKVSQISWKVTTIDNQGNPKEQTLKSIDWNSNQTELSVFFYDK
ncbi:MAG: PKD domain-containing protein [Saprospiraceae bacterium]|nr:PKD domain-containing protein [Saprospiraceae bacterium]MBK7737214.1 PKD domain-containing protein [Saprospiraceae bacterium]